MKQYRLVVLGENFLVNLDGKLSRCGFRAVRFVDASDASEARERAVALLRRQLKDKVLNLPSDTPTLLVEDAAEIDAAARTEAGQGIEWFPAARKPAASAGAKRYVFAA